LTTVPAIDQSDLDRIFGGDSGPSPQVSTGRPPPKGLSPESAELVRRALQKFTGGLSASECAEQTGLSRVSARRYLEHFVQTGEAEVRLRYGGTGRPQRRYAWRTA
jgi:response regulator of citrate/malate metabolism